MRFGYAAYIATSLMVLAQAKKEHYKRFAKLMKQYGFTWEAVKVKTDDGYTLTTFHILGNEDGPFTPTMPPVLI